MNFYKDILQVLLFSSLEYSDSQSRAGLVIYFNFHPTHIPISNVKKTHRISQFPNSSLVTVWSKLAFSRRTKRDCIRVLLYTRQVTAIVCYNVNFSFDIHATIPVLISNVSESFERKYAQKSSDLFFFCRLLFVSLFWFLLD